LSLSNWGQIEVSFINKHSAVTDSIDKLTQVERRGKEIMAELHIEVILCDEDEPRIRHDTNREE